MSGWELLHSVASAVEYRVKRRAAQLMDAPGDSDKLHRRCHLSYCFFFDYHCDGRTQC